MKTITIEELIEKLKKFKNEYILVVLEGNIQEKISMHLTEVNKEKDYIEMVYNKTKSIEFGKSLRINIHQIKNIESNEDAEFYIYLDGNQKVIIFTDMKVLINHNLLNWINKCIYS